MNSKIIKSYIQQNFSALCSDSALFDELALEIFSLQRAENSLYKTYLELTGQGSMVPQVAAEIPALPIQLFKSQDVRSGNWTPADFFLSSGTTGMEQSRHPVRDMEWYDWVSRQIFESFYGGVEGYSFLALLPGYLERTGSSLIAMMHSFIAQSRSPHSGFFLHDTEALLDHLEASRKEGFRTLLFGVSFALLDLAETGRRDLEGVVVMETGGMKGRRKEMIRSELHGVLQQHWHLDAVHSEYGMTELFSQGYSRGGGVFEPGATMRVYPRDMTDPFAGIGFHRTGALNVVDLANIDTISFIATEDLGKCYPDGTFEVLGRLDNSDIRGCNLLLG